MNHYKVILMNAHLKGICWASTKIAHSSQGRWGKAVEAEYSGTIAVSTGPACVWT